MNERFEEILARLKSGHVVPYLGPGILQGVIAPTTGQPLPVTDEAMILAMTGGQPMSPRLMYELSRAAMHLENKKGRSFIERFMTKTYGGEGWTPAPVHRWLASLNLPYIIDCNRDTLLQQCYADRAHTLVVGCARLMGTHYRFEIYQWQDGSYQAITQEQANPELPVLFKPLGTPLPKPTYIASDADYVDYITELMGGFAIPSWLKTKRKDCQYLFLGLHFSRDTERMVMSDLIYDAAPDAGWAFIAEPSPKERKVCSRKKIELIEKDWSELLAATSG
ncbi:SIR2-like protein [Azomonas agilis]|uniref:SIR2-like protein n=1 Tax=Azomonas agilis TaxID=116849 RepID=A0A562J2T1_9GAMM|nr:SIR2 family protein [Azomonas agilis]TWH77432.1 SIR2-like protein [Azomonas agilis]